MVSPLVEYSELRSTCKVSDAVLSDNSHAETCNELMYTVIYLLIDMIRSAGEDDYMTLFSSCLFDYLSCLVCNVGMVAVESLVSSINSSRDASLDVVFLQHFTHYSYNVLFDIEVEIRVNEVLVIESCIVSEEKLRIISDYRAVEVVIASALVDIVAHAGVENEVYALIEKILDMSVRELCRVAYCIRRDSVLTEIIHTSGAFIGGHNSEAEACKEHMPEWELLIEAECERKSDNATVSSWLVSFYSIDDTVVLIFIEVRYLVLNRVSAALFAAVS